MSGPPIATMAFLAFIAGSLVAFQRLSRASATVVVVLAGSLFLPENVALLEMRGFPTIEKERVTYLSALLGLAIRGYIPDRRSTSGVGLTAVLVLMFLANVGTLLINPAPLYNEGLFFEGLGTRWLIGQTLDDILVFGLPLMVGRAAFRDTNDLRTLMYALVGAGLIYTGLIAVEVLLSIPFWVFQLSQLIYNVPMRPQFRYGFTQPIVFMDNGLAVATYMAVAVIAAASFRKTRAKRSWMGIRRVMALLLCGLLMTMNVAGSVYGLVMATLTAWSRSTRIAAVALFIAAFTCVYPALRMMDVFPHTALVEFADQYDPDRARSLNGRFAEEDFVLGSIGERIWFGWGHIGRIPGVHSFGEGETGLDGWWVIRTGMSGLLGLQLSYIFFLLVPVLVGWRCIGRLRSHDGAPLFAGLLLCIAVRMVDLLINGWWNCMPVFLGGAALGIAGSTRRSASHRDSFATPGSGSLPRASSQMISR